MSGGGVLRAVLAAASDDELRELAELLRPFLAESESAPDASPWLHGQRAIAEHLGLPLSTVEKLTAANALPVHRLGERRRISARADELDAWAATQRDGPAPAPTLRLLGGGQPRGPRGA